MCLRFLCPNVSPSCHNKVKGESDGKTSLEVLQTLLTFKSFIRLHNEGPVLRFMF